MKYSLASLASVTAFAGLASADFLLYHGMNTHIPDAGSNTGWWTFDGEPSCDDVYNSIPHLDSDDVSGTKWGARCKGCDGNDWTAEDVEELEININVDGDGPHWTMYKDRGRNIVDLDGNTIGSCEIKEDDDFFCSIVAQTADGSSYFSCTSDLTADDMKPSD